ncbi:MAG: thioesterase family protein [Anaerovoracaceae bacterium]|nr:thioesterase family protein [Anaerovoracaceae bacterium]
MEINETDVYPLYADTDAMQIVYHGSYVPWLELGRTKLMENLVNQFQTETGKELWLPIIELDIKYKNPALLYEHLVVRTRVKSMRAATIEFAYEVINKQTRELHVKATTKHPITDTERHPVNIKKEYPKFYERIINMIE